MSIASSRRGRRFFLPITLISSMTQKSTFPWYLLTTLVVGALLIAAYAGLVRSTSVDLAHNYALVLRLSENWHLVPDDPTLGEMNIYPRSSHIAGAFVGSLVGSPFLGMHLVSLASTVLLWVSCLAIMYAAPHRSGPFNALALAAVVLLNFGIFRIHGSEITGNYYYAQLAAQSLAFAAMAAAVWLDPKVHRAWIYLLLLGVIHVATGVHLLPALELLGLLAGLAALDAVFAQPGARLRGALLGGLALAAGIALVVLHPSFAAMRAIALHNGGVGLGPLRPFWSVVIVSLLVLASALSLLRIWLRDRAANVVHKYLAIYGAVVAGLFLLQAVLRYVGLGSDYAAKKYAFGLVTFLFLHLALWLSPKIHARLQRKPKLALFCDSPAGRVVVFGLALAVTVAGVAHTRRSVDAMGVVAIERQLRALPPAPLAGKPALVVDTAGMPDVIDYMFSIAVARTPREIALQAFVGGEALDPVSHPSQYGFILSSRGHSRFAGADRCSTLPGGPILVLEGACVEKAMHAAMPGVPGVAAAAIH
jgi:hypothetical protein